MPDDNSPNTDPQDYDNDDPSNYPLRQITQDFKEFSDNFAELFVGQRPIWLTRNGRTQFRIDYANSAQLYRLQLRDWQFDGHMVLAGKAVSITLDIGQFMDIWRTIWRHLQTTDNGARLDNFYRRNADIIAKYHAYFGTQPQGFAGTSSPSAFTAAKQLIVPAAAMALLAGKISDSYLAKLYRHNKLLQLTRLLARYYPNERYLVVPELSEDQSSGRSD